MGQEVNDQNLEPECNHLLCHFVDSDLDSVAADPQKLIDTALERGGLCFLAHLRPVRLGLPIMAPSEGERRTEPQQADSRPSPVLLVFRTIYLIFNISPLGVQWPLSVNNVPLFDPFPLGAHPLVKSRQVALLAFPHSLLFGAIHR